MLGNGDADLCARGVRSSSEARTSGRCSINCAGRLTGGSLGKRRSASLKVSLGPGWGSARVQGHLRREHVKMRCETDTSAPETACQARIAAACHRHKTVLPGSPENR
jgi:hypothetical protein